MAKIKKTDISKLSKIDKQIEELKQQKKEKQEQLSKKIGEYFLSQLDVETIEDSDVIYDLIDRVITDLKENQENLNQYNTETEHQTEINNIDN